MTPAAPEDWREVLAQPTRRRLFRLLERSGRPAGTDELAEELGLHPSGVRVHLERLRRAELVVRERAAQPRGRPRDSWRLAADALRRVEPPSAYEQLARWLARSIPARPRRLAEIERTGRELGRDLAAAGDLAGRGAAPVPAAMTAILTELGFAPLPRRPRGGRASFELGRCPYRDAVRENQPVVCTLHRGLTAGLLDRLDPRAQLTAFVPGDPDRAGCLIEVAAGRDDAGSSSRRRR